MTSISFIESAIIVKNLMTTTTESWFIPFDILMIVCTTLAIILAILFLSIIILDRTCHTIPMMLIANSCVSAFVSGCILLNTCIFTLENDLKQIQYQDSLCICRAYFFYVSSAIISYSFLIQAIYRFVTVVYPNRLFWQSFRFQISSICFAWIIGFIYPTAFMFTNEMVYNIDNQICQLPLRLSFSICYAALCTYVIPLSMIMFIYFKLIRYVRAMSKRVTPVNILSRAQRELQMFQRTVILITVLITVGFPYALFILISFFTNPPKYHFRIAYLFIDVSLVCMVIVLFQFTEPLKTSIMKRINGRPNRVVPTIT